MDFFTFSSKLFVSACAVEACRLLVEVDQEWCCGCKASSTTECLMLTEEEKMDLYLEYVMTLLDLEQISESVLYRLQPFEMSDTVCSSIVNWLATDPTNDVDIKNSIKECVRVIRMY